MNRESLEELLLASRAGALNEEDRVRLNALLRDDSEARAFAARFLATDALLADVLESSSAERQFVSRHQRRTWIGWGMVAVAASVMLAVMTTTMVQQDNPVAVLSGEELRPGRVLTIDDGESKIRFDSGAILAVEAPAKLEVLGSNAARLHYGVATVRVPGPIKGFELETPAEKVVDLGTSFGVTVQRSGNSMVTVFEGEVELGDRELRQRVVAGSAVRLSQEDGTPRESISYDTTPFQQTWKSSFGVEGLQGDVRFAQPGQRKAPAQVIDRDSLLLIPEREGVNTPAKLVLNIVKPGAYTARSATFDNPSGREKFVVSERNRVDSYLLQYNPGLPSPTSKDRRFRTEIQFDREIIGIITEKNLLAKYDPLLALEGADFSGQHNRGLFHNDEVVLSEDRRTVRVAWDIEDGVDQIRVLVASHLTTRIDETASR